jgi:hypothetical protein
VHPEFVEKMSDTVSEAPSGLGFVRVNRMHVIDTLPCCDSKHHGRRMSGVHNSLIKVYLRNTVNGDTFFLLVPFNLKVGPSNPAKHIGGLSFDSPTAEPPNFKAMISEYTGIPLTDLRLMFKQEAYNICHGSTVSILFKAIRKIPADLMLACSANRSKHNELMAKYRDKLISSYASRSPRPVHVMLQWHHDHSPHLFEEGGDLSREMHMLTGDHVYTTHGEVGEKALPVMRYENHTLMD